MKHVASKALVVACALALGVATTPALAADALPSDTWSKAALTTTYALNRHLNPFRIDVDVNHGVATLRGQVDSEVDRALAEELALGVDGIREVINQLKVVPGDLGDQAARAPGAPERSFLRKVEDANITAKVKSQLLWNESTHGLDINVDTRSGIVKLKGSVASDAESQLAEQIARNTGDVLGVENNLRISTQTIGLAERAAREGREFQQQVSDSWITAKVKSALLYNRHVEGNDIDVETHNGVVTLQGTVDSPFEKQQAVAVAGAIQGVKQVRDKLRTGV